VEAQAPNGEQWDSMGGGAPDLKYSVTWRGNRVFESTVRHDSLLARWPLTAFDIGKTALYGGKTSLDETVQAARVSLAPEEEVTFAVIDSDPMMSDEICSFPVRMGQLNLGENVLTKPCHSIRKAVVRLVDPRSPRDFTE
jgi:hypothetical protein